jgi:hypothetical protein
MSRLLRRSALVGLSAVLGFFALTPTTAQAAPVAKPDPGTVSIGAKVALPSTTVEALQASGERGIVKIATKKTSFTSYNSGIILTDGALFCPYPWLDTAYGPIGQCSLSDGVLSQVGFYSPLTDAFNAQGDPLPISPGGAFCVEDSLTGCFVVQTVYGNVMYMTEYWDNPQYGPIARWGNFNFDANGGAGQWFPAPDWHVQDLCPPDCPVPA